MKAKTFIVLGIAAVGVSLTVLVALAVDSESGPAAPSAATAPSADMPKGIKYVAGRKIANIRSRRIIESSGIAPSRRLPGVFWTHNDSGGLPTIHAFGADGRDLGMFTVTGASNNDWEDMASYSIGGESFLIMGDFGDNRSRRSSCTLYIVPEPQVSLKGVKRGSPAGRTAPARKIHYVYKDGPADCESLAVDAVNRTIYLITKRPRHTIYALPLDPAPKAKAKDDKAADKPQVAAFVGNVRLSMPTAMDMSPDGLRAVVLTYGDAFEYVRRATETWKVAFARQPHRIPAPQRYRGEGICYGADGKTLYLTSEGLRSALMEIPVAKQPASAPRAPFDKLRASQVSGKSND